MRIRTFHAASIANALAQVREALGEDAIIVSTLEEDGGVRVVAAAERADREPEPPSTDDPPDADSELAQALDYHGVPPELAGRLVKALGAVPPISPEMRLAAALDGTFRFAPVTARDRGRPLMFVGPPGAGKTTTVAKLAARFALKGLPVSVVSLDTIRAAGLDQLASFTSLLGLDLRAASSPSELGTAIADCTAGCPILIDTAGINPFDESDVAAMRELRDAARAEVVLVMAAGIDAFEAREVADGCRPLAPSRLIATRVDAARRLGGMLAAAAGDLAFAEVGHAPRIADGLSSINPVSLARLIIRDPFAPVSRLDQSETTA
jgi:flagellar biosynthesis protein FlhF